MSYWKRDWKMRLENEDFRDDAAVRVAVIFRVRQWKMVTEC